MFFETITFYDFVIFWTAVNSTERTELVFIEKITLNAHRCLAEVLTRQPKLNALGKYFIFMDDNTRAHHSGDEEAYMQEECLLCLDWADLNPIKHVGDVLKR